VIYTGQVRCNGQLYPGEQEAIVDCELWNGVNRLLGALPQRVPRVEKWRRSGEVDPKGWTKFGRRLDGAAR